MHLEWLFFCFVVLLFCCFCDNGRSFLAVNVPLVVYKYEWGSHSIG